ncbi:MAG: hypothetical protein AAGI23_11480 [Bacteroidota bacterium]
MKTRNVWIGLSAWLVVALVALTKPISLCAQQQAPRIDYYYILDQVEQGLQVGDPMSLRNAALLLDKVSVKAQALALLDKYTLFTPREFRFSEYTTKRNFLNFFYRYQDQLQYSLPMKAFYITPLEDRPLLYQVELMDDGQLNDAATRLKAYIDLYEKAMLREDILSAETQIERIGEIGSVEANDYLLQLIAEKSFRRRYAKLTLAVVKELSNYRNEETLRRLVRLSSEKAVPPFALLNQLAKLTNVKVNSPNNINRYTQLLDSLGSINTIRQFGYDQHFPFRPLYFTDTVAYLGKVLYASDTLPQVQQNVLGDLMRSDDPRSLYHLAMKAYRIAARKEKSELVPQELYRQLQSRLAARVLIADRNGTYIAEPDWRRDPTAVLNFAHYWVAHYEDFEWDPYRQKFINQTISSTLGKLYKRYIQQLNSTNDSVAWQAYLALTEGEPREVRQLTELFRPVLNNQHATLPPIQYAYLERIAELTDFCRRNNVFYQPKGQIKTVIDRLYEQLPPHDRYRLEKELDALVQLNDLTALEYQVLLYAASRPMTYSLSWVIDRAYTRHWDDIFSDDEELRLYLKKAYLFRRIGTDGVCNLYTNKLDLSSDRVKNRLSKLLALETDGDIVQQIEQLLLEREEVQLYTWRDLKDKEFDLRLLPKPDKTELPAIFSTINETLEERTRLKYIFYLSLYPSVDQTPFLIKLLEDRRMVREAISLLELIYSYDFNNQLGSPKDNWLIYWENYQKSYKNWGEQFIERRLQELRRSDHLSIYDINAITTSPYYKPLYRNIVLDVIDQVQPVRNLRRLKINPALSTARELRYIKDVEFSTRDLLDVLRIVDIDDNQKLFEFFLDQADYFESPERVGFLVSLIETDWFDQFLGDPKTFIPVKKLAQLRKDIDRYSINKKVLERDQQRATLALAKLAADEYKQLDLRLAISFEMKEQNSVTVKDLAIFQELALREATFDELSIIVNNWRNLSPAVDYNVIHERFGLPVFGLSDPTTLYELSQNIQTMDDDQLYRHYLRSFGVDFETDRGRLDFQKIYELLKYGVVYPFVESDQPRNYYVNGLIRVLELYFEDTLGFNDYFEEEEQLNSHSIRAYRWMLYLAENTTAREKANTPPSFAYYYLQSPSS